MRLELETLISDTAAALFTSPAELVAPAVERALARLRTFLQADGCAVLDVSADQQAAKVRLASSADGHQVSAGADPMPLFAWSRERLLVQGAPIRASRVADLPPEAEAERNAWMALPIRSLLVLPIETGDAVRHLLLLQTAARECEWPEHVAVRLRVLGRILVHAAEVQAAAAGWLVAEKRLAQSEARWIAATDLADVAYYEIDFETGTWSWSDDHFRALLGVPRERQDTLDAIQFWLDHIHPDDRPRVMEQRARLQGGELSRLVIEYRFLHGETGDERWFEHVGRAGERDAGGRPRRTFGVIRDVTERRRAEDALKQSFAEIVELKERLQAESEYLKAEVRVTQAHGELTGESSAISNVKRLVEQVAPTDSSVLVLGETGCGKELVARAIHRLSPRAAHLMVTVNCAALPSGLIESELFGRERGAFTGALTRQAGRFEVADGSTLFLDEIGNLSLDLQAKLLRVLETGEFERLGSSRTIRVNVRLIAATNRDLPEAIKQGLFREDVYYRLNVFPIRVPPLRDRREDIPALVWALLGDLNTRFGKKISQVPRKAMEALQRHPWPGNVRQLRNVIEHAAIVTTGDTLNLPGLDETSSLASSPQTLADAERSHILKTLETTGWRVGGPKGAAAMLGLNASTLRSRMKKLHIRSRWQGDANRT